MSYLNLTFPQDERRPRQSATRQGTPWDPVGRPRFASLSRRCPCSPSCSPSPVARLRRAPHRTALADPLRTSKVLRLPGGPPPPPPPPSLSARQPPPGGSRCLPVRERRRNTSPAKVSRTTCSRERPPRPVAAATTSVGGAAVLLAAAGAEYQSAAPAASPPLLASNPAVASGFAIARDHRSRPHPYPPSFRRRSAPASFPRRRRSNTDDGGP